MEVESSNDIQSIEICDSDNAQDAETRPIMRLFKCLISNDKEQNTMLTNAQLIEILETEFNIKIAVLHELEVDIYLSIIKKFLLHWPQWDEFDREVTKLKQTSAKDKIEKTLEQKYLKLKEYLKVMVDVAKTKAQKIIKTIEESQDVSENGKKSEKEAVVLELFCSRAQLNDLIFRYPLAEQQNTIFNQSTGIKKTINFMMYDFKTILQYWNVKVSFMTKDLSFTYHMNQNIQHTLINKKHSNNAYEKVVLNGDLQKRQEKKTTKTISVNSFYHILSNLIIPENQSNLINFIKVMSQIFKRDFGDYDFIEIPGRYKRYICKYPYVRYLYVDDKSENSKYDLQVEEVFTPSVSYALSHMETKILPPKKITANPVTFECYVCSTTGTEVAFNNLIDHFMECHLGEKELMCTNCGRKTDLLEIGEKGWFHQC